MAISSTYSDRGIRSLSNFAILGFYIREKKSVMSLSIDEPDTKLADTLEYLLVIHFGKHDIQTDQLVGLFT